MLTLGFVGGFGFWKWSDGPGSRAMGATETTPDANPVEGETPVIVHAEPVAKAAPQASAPPPVAGEPEVAAVADLPRVGLAPSDRHPRRRIRVAYDAGRSYMAMGRHRDAVPHLAEAVRLDPDFAEAHYNLGLAYVQYGDMEAARVEYAALLQLDGSLACLLGNLVQSVRDSADG